MSKASVSNAVLATAVLMHLFVTGCGVQAPAQDEAELRSPAAGIIRFYDISNVDVRDVPMLIALDALEAQGYTVETTLLSNSSLIAEGLAQGEADIGLFNNQTSWNAIHKGAGLRTVAQSVSSTTVFAARKEIESCAGLQGKAVGLANTAGLSPAVLNLYLQENCPGTEPQFLVIPESAGRTAALLAGELDAALMPGEELLKLQQMSRGGFHALYTAGKAYPHILQDGLHVRREWAEENPEIVKDFLRALLNANRQVRENSQLLYEEAAKRLELDPAVVKPVVDAHLHNGIWDVNGGLTAQSVQDTIDFLVEIEKLPEGLKVEEVADLSYLNTVLDEIGRK